MPTRSDILGPYYKAGAPAAAALADPADPGVRFAVSGQTMDTCLRPISGALLDVWQADDTGAYDAAGFRFRGMLSSDSDGRYDLQTIIPGHYRNGSKYRPAHIHLKVSAPGFVPLTTQLYFEGDPYNAIDPWFNVARMLRLTDAPGGKQARFNFILAAA